MTTIANITMMINSRNMLAIVLIYKLCITMSFRWVGQTLWGQAGTFKKGQPFVETIEHIPHIPHIQYETDSKKRMPPPQVKPRSRPAGKGHHWRGVGVGSGERALVLYSGKEGVAGPSTGSSYTGMTSGGGRITDASSTDGERDSGPGSRTVPSSSNVKIFLKDYHTSDFYRLKAYLQPIHCSMKKMER